MTAGWKDVLGEQAALLRAVAYFGPIPSDNIAHRPDLPDKLRKDLIDALVDLNTQEQGRQVLSQVFNAQAFVPTSRRLYDALRDVLTTSGLTE